MKNIRTKATSILVAGALALTLPFNIMASESVGADINTTASHVINKGLTSDFTVAALSKAGKLSEDQKVQYGEKLKTRVNSKTVKGNELSKTIIAVRAVGLDPTNFEGQNLIEMLTKDTSLNTVTAKAYALIALDTADYEIPKGNTWDKQKLIDVLTSSDTSTGGWGWAGAKGAPDIDSTGMVLTALGDHKDNAVVKADIDKAVNYLEGKIEQDGGFNNSGINSNSTSQVIIGLSSVGEDPTQGAFSKPKGNPISNLMTYKIGGGFKWKHTETKENTMATEQAFQALVAYDSYLGGGDLYDFPFPVKEDPAEPETPQEPTPEEPTHVEPTTPSTPIVIDNNNKNNNTIVINIPADGDLSDIEWPEGVTTETIERITEQVNNNNNSIEREVQIKTNNNESDQSTPSQTSDVNVSVPAANVSVARANPLEPQTIVLMQQPAQETQQASEEPANSTTKEKKTEVNPLNAGVGAASVIVGGIALALRKKFMGV